MCAQAINEKAVFKVACSIESEEARDDYLDQVCGDSRELRDRVVKLLRMQDEEPGFLESPLVGCDPTLDVAPITERLGTQIGPYKLLREIGEGGFGVVYAAEQKEPHRKVALKIIKPGMDTREVMARFQAEEQALAMMDHPNIAKVHDAGATDTGRPYFVMELVDGVPITEYCDDHDLTTVERLRLFVSVCCAVKHAHQKGIIHRDIKPSNILVTLQDGQPVPKIIDFGIAKAMHQPLTAGTLYTRCGQLIGTPLYMSPEQAGRGGLDIDTRSDIYSLGVVLYELLTGTTPFDKQRLREAGVDELHQILCEEEPPRPSMRVSTLAAEHSTTISQHRGVDPRRLRKLVAGDLDWIVMKALEKNRSRRYETASDFAQDIQRYLSNEAVEACPPSTMYRIGKFARRNKTALISVSAVLLSSMFGLVAITLFSLGQRKMADQKREMADQGLRVQRDINDAVTKVARLRGQITAANVNDSSALAQAREQAQRALALADAGPVAPALVAQVRQLSAELDQQQREQQLLVALDEAWLAQVNMMGDVFNDLACIPQLRETLQAYGISTAKTSPDQCAAVIKASSPRVQTELLAALHEWYALTAPLKGIIWRKVAGKRVIEFVCPYSSVARDARLQVGDRLVGVGARPDGSIVDTTGMTTAEIRKLFFAASGAMARLRVIPAGKSEPQIYEIARGPSSAWLKAVLDAVDKDAWRRRVRESYSVTDMAKRRSALEKLAKEADADGQSVRVLARLASDLRRVDAKKCAYSLLQQVWCNHPNDVGVNHELACLMYYSKPQQLAEEMRYLTAAVALRPNSYGLRNNLGRVLEDQGRYTEAVAEYREVLKIEPELAFAHSNLGNALTKLGRLEEAIAACREALRIDSNWASAHVNLGVALLKQGKQAEAISEYREALRIDPDRAHAHYLLGCAFKKERDLEAAILELREAIRLDPERDNAHTMLGFAYLDQGRREEAIAEIREGIRLDPPGNPTERITLQQLLADPSYADFRPAEVHFSNEEYGEALAIISRVLKSHPKSAGALHLRGWIYQRRAQFEEALANFNKTIELAPSRRHYYFNRACVYRELGMFDRALADCRTAIELDPKRDKWWFQIDRAYALRGDIYAQNLQQYQDAVADYSQAIKLKSLSPVLVESPVLFEKRAKAYQAMGDSERATADREEAARLSSPSVREEPEPAKKTDQSETADPRTKTKEAAKAGKNAKTEDDEGNKSEENGENGRPLVR